MSTAASVTTGQHAARSMPWWEITLVMALYLLAALIFPGFRSLLAVPLVIYMLTESLLRHRSWAENGFDLRSILSGFRQTVGWVLLVAFGTQALSVLGEKFFLPDVSAHILARIPYDISSLNAGLFITFAVSTFLEELIFRALFQNRLSTFVSPAVSIGVVSVVFIMAHYTPGPGFVVFIDLLGVFVDSLIYGIIFQRSKNVFVAWIPHFIADMFAIILMVMIK